MGFDTIAHESRRLPASLLSRRDPQIAKKSCYKARITSSFWETIGAWSEHVKQGIIRSQVPKDSAAVYGKGSETRRESSTSVL